MSTRLLAKILFICSILGAPALISVFAHAAEKSGGSTAKEPSEKINVDDIKEKYWAQGNENELGVVQNRAYSKQHKFELGAFGGIVASDPFLSVKSLGGSFGFHFSEYLAVHAFGWKAFAGNSSALDTFEDLMRATTNTNKPKSYYGAEASASLVYGKLSLVGKAIIYYDMHILGGAGVTNTESGNYFTPHIGIGQQIYVSKRASIRLDYRLMAYREWIVEKVVPVPGIYGSRKDMRNNYSNAVTLGIDFLIGKDQ